jgi:hypothetical protein
MDQAKDRELYSILDRLSVIREAVLGESPGRGSDLDRISDQAGILMDMRQLVLASPTWPFTDTAEIARVVTAVVSPMLYFIANEILRAYVIPFLTR